MSFHAFRKTELTRADIIVVSVVVHVFRNCQPCMKSGSAATRSQDPPLVAILSSTYPVRIPHSAGFITIVTNVNVETFKACSLNPRMSSSFCRRLCQCVLLPSVADTHLLGLFQFLPVTSNYALWLFRYICNSVYCDRLCGLVVRVSGYRYRGLGFDSRRYQIF